MVIIIFGMFINVEYRWLDRCKYKYKNKEQCIEFFTHPVLTHYRPRTLNKPRTQLHKNVK